MDGNVPVWVVTILVGALVALIGIVYRRSRSDHNALARQVQKLREELSEITLSEFISMDKEREKHWMKWREDIEHRLESSVKGFSEWRHNEYAPRIAEIFHGLLPLKEKVSILERNKLIKQKGGE
jgi:hypothetical protein